MDSDIIKIIALFVLESAFLVCWSIAYKSKNSVKSRGLIYLSGVAGSLAFICLLMYLLSFDSSTKAPNYLELFQPRSTLDAYEHRQVKLSSLKVYTWSGELNTPFVDYLENLPSGSTVSLTSAGGEAIAASAGSRILLEKQISVVIKERCMSACADYLLPAAKQIELDGFPSIGFHGNPVAALHFVYGQNLHSTVVPDRLRRCQYLARWLSETWKKGGLRLPSVLSTMSILHPFALSAPAGYCPNVIYEKKWFLPKAKTLERILGRSIKGKTCADSEICVQKFLDQRQLSLNNIVID